MKDNDIQSFLINVVENKSFSILNRPLSIEHFTDAIADASNVTCYIISASLVSQLLTGTNLIDYFDPNTKYETLRNGYVGSILGRPVITDGYLAERIIPMNGFLAYADTFDGDSVWQRP